MKHSTYAHNNFRSSSAPPCEINTVQKSLPTLAMQVEQGSKFIHSDPLDVKFPTWRMVTSQAEMEGPTSLGDKHLSALAGPVEAALATGRNTVIPSCHHLGQGPPAHAGAITHKTMRSLRSETNPAEN